MIKPEDYESLFQAKFAFLMLDADVNVIFNCEAFQFTFIQY